MKRPCLFFSACPLLLSTFGPVQAIAQVPTDGLVVYYPFNGNANDESGNGINGVAIRAVLTADRFGNANSAYEFSGVDAYIDLGDNDALRILGDLTISTWIKVDNFPVSFSTIVGWGGYGDVEATNGAYGFFITNDAGVNYLGNSHESGEGVNTFAISTRPLSTGIWIHAAVVRNSVLKTYRTYIDAVPETDISYTTNATGGEDGTGFIGWSPTGTPGQGLDGIIDDVRLYDRVLSDSEILELFNEGGDPIASPGVSYGSTGSAELNNPGALISIDPLTGAGTLIGPTGIIGDDGTSVRALAIKSTGEMYALSFEASSDLYTVNASTGTATFVANTGLLHPGDMTFDANDVLYAVDETNFLYTVDPVTGTRTILGATGVTLGGLAYDPTDGTIYGSGNNDGIYTINVTTGAATLVGTTGLGGNTPDILFDQAGNLFGVKKGAGGISNYIAIDKTTGAGTVIGPTGFIAVIGLATRLLPPPAVPCGDITRFQARCRLGGTIQARIILSNTTHTGDVVEFTIDGTPYQVSVESNGRALLSIGVFAVGDHTVELADPPGCYDPLTVRCSAGVAKPGDDFWDEDASWETPQTTALLGNFPNPFNPSTTLRYALNEPGQVTLSVYDMLGQLVRTVVNEYQSDGYHEAIWDGKNESGAGVSSGIYIYRMTVGKFTETKRMLLLK